MGILTGNLTNTGLVNLNHLFRRYKVHTSHNKLQKITSFGKKKYFPHIHIYK